MFCITVWADKTSLYLFKVIYSVSGKNVQDREVTDSGEEKYVENETTLQTDSTLSFKSWNDE